LAAHGLGAASAFRNAEVLKLIMSYATRP